MKLSIAQINYPPGLVFGFKKKSMLDSSNIFYTNYIPLIIYKVNCILWIQSVYVVMLAIFGIQLCH